MKSTPTGLPGVLLIEPVIFRDDRGYFLETYRSDHYAEAGVTVRFVQDNISFSRHRVIRGLHLQSPNGQAKLVSVPRGEVFDVAVDVRAGSPTFGHWVGFNLSEENGRQLFIPAGFAHGFQVLSEAAMLSYKCSEVYDPKSEITILWNDPDLAIQWPLSDPVLSEKDAAGIRLSRFSARASGQEPPPRSKARGG